MKILIVLLIAAFSVVAQVSRQCSAGPSNANRYVTVKETGLTASAEKVTIQQPVIAGSPAVAFECADIYCSVACEIFFYQNGTADTTTGLTITPLNTSSPPSAVAFSASNVGGSAYKAYYIVAGGTMTFDLTSLFLPGGASGNANLSIGTCSMTGTVRIQIQHIEVGA